MDRSFNTVVDWSFRGNRGGRGCSIIIFGVGGVGFRDVWTMTVLLTGLCFLRLVFICVYVPLSTKGLGLIALVVWICCVVEGSVATGTIVL